MKEDLMLARIRDAENTQCVAELTQKISSLEYKVSVLLSISLVYLLSVEIARKWLILHVRTVFVGYVASFMYAYGSVR